MKKLLTLLMVLALVLTMLAGCGNSASSSESVSAPVGSSAAVSEPAEPSAPETAEQEPSAAETEEVESVYPLSEELVTLTYWTPDNSTSNTVLPTYGDMSSYSFWTYVEEQTGVHLKLDVVSMANESEQLNLRLASMDLTDIMAVNESLVAGGISALVADDLIVDIAASVEDDMPNYYAFISGDDTRMKLAYDDSGNMPGIRAYAEKYVPNQGLMIRQDLAEEQGLALPTTIDELHDVLAAFKNAYDMESPLWMGTSGQNSVHIAGALGTIGFAQDMGSSTDHLYLEDGQVVSSLNKEGYRDYLELMHQWYEEGLFSKDFAVQTDMDAANTSILNNQTAVFNSMYGQALTIQDSLQADNPNAMIYAIPTPVENAGDENSFFSESPLSNSSWRVISYNCEDVDLALKYIDWWYTEDGFRTGNYGVEGESYYVEDGTPYYSELVTDNEWGIDATSAVEAFITTNPVFGLVSMDRTVYLAGADWVSEMLDIWMEQRSDENVIPSGVALTTDETEEVSAILSDISTYASTEILKFIIGSRDISDWDSFVSDVEGMGLEEVLSVYQTAYERYLAR